MEAYLSGEVDKYEVEFRMFHKSGDLVWILSRAKVVERDINGNPTRMIGAHSDITDRKKAQDALARSESLLNNIIEQSPFSMWISDAEGTLQRINPACKKWTQLTEDEVVGSYNVLKDEAIEAQELMPLVRSVFEEGKVVSFELAWDSSLLKHIRHTETTNLILDVTVFPVKDSNGVITNAVCQHIDITEQKAAQQALKESELRYRSLFNNAVLGIFQSTPQGTYKELNAAFARVFGFESPDEMKMAISDIGPQLYVRPEDRDQIKARLENYGAIENYETEIRRKDGTTRWISINARAVRDEEGKALYYDGTIEDITDRKQAQDAIRRLNIELEQRVRDRTAQLELANEEIKAFAYSISHDLKAPLRAISGFAHIIADRHRATLNKEGRHYFDNIVQASGQMDLLIDDLLSYSRIGRQAIKMVHVDLERVVAQAILYMNDRIHETGATVIVQGEYPEIISDGPLIERILINLLDNALTYVREGTSAWIVVEGETGPDYVIIKISDNGIGISPQNLNKIFHIFQRLHNQERYPGTGIGLAIVRKSAGLLGGDVWVESEVGRGSTFCLRLPYKRPQDDEAV